MPSSPGAALSFARGGDIALAPDEPISLAQRIAERVEARPDGVIRSYRGDGVHQARSRAALWRQAGDVAAALTAAAAAGTVPASFVVVLAEDILDFLPSVWGCLRGGFVPVALMGVARDARSGAFDALVASLGDPVIIVDDMFKGLIARMARPPSGRVVPLASVTPVAAWPDVPGIPDPAWLVATSGSTGRPKLAALSNRAVLFRNFAQRHSLGEALPNALGTFPLDGVTGQHAAFLHHDNWTQISSQLLMARPNAILDAVETCEIAAATLTTSMIRALLAAEAAEREQGSGRPRRLGSLRLVGLGAEPVSAGLVQAFATLLERHGADPGVLMAGYGTTETGSLVAGSRKLLTTPAAQPVCLGQPWHGVAMRIVDGSGTILPEGETGELEVSCPAKMFSGYWGDPELTNAAFTADGWWRTGDLGHLSEGELTLGGRAKDVLIQNGRKLSLTDIDAEIQRVLGFAGVGHGYLLTGTDTRGEALGIAFDTGQAWGEEAGAEQAGAEPDAAAMIATAIVRSFGVQPQRVTWLAAERIPRTASGKVQRAALAELASQSIAPGLPTCTGAEAERSAARLGAIWSDVLGLDRAARFDDKFFELGGDSLRALTLDLKIAEEFGFRVPSEAFFADPIFGTLLWLVRQRLGSAGDAGRAPGRDTGWPLSTAHRRNLLFALAHWPGERAAGDALIAGHHTGGDQPPLFWVFNDPNEAIWLAQAIGTRQPLYAMRSGYQLIDYREDEIQAFALSFVAEIEQLCPSGPLFVAGNCQGGVIALAIAQHLLRRKRHVPLLILMDFAFELQPYRGRVLMIAGADNANLNPRRAFARPDLAWARHFAACSFAEISGGYAEGFREAHIGSLVGALRDHMVGAIGEAPALLPESGYHAVIEGGSVPAELGAGERRTITVSVTNGSDIVWAATSASGLVISSRWLQTAGPLEQPPQPRARLPQLAPGESVTVRLRLVAPGTAGEFTVVLDVVEDGNRWFGGTGPDCCTARVRVSPRSPAWRRLLRAARGL